MLQYCQSQCVWCIDGIQFEGWVGESDGLREEAVSCYAGSGPDAAVPSA